MITIIIITLILLISIIYFPNNYSVFGQRLKDFNDLQDQSAAPAGNVINASDINNMGPSSAETDQANQSLSSNSLGSGQSPSITIDDSEQSIDPNTLLQQLQRPIVGSFGDDRIIGTQETDIIIGFSGSDTITGLNGSDVMQGNEGQDKLYGDEGDDILQGGIGSDQLYGGAENDILAGGADDDFLVGEEGNDKLYGDLGDDVLVGGPGADYFDCGEGVDVVADFNLQQGDDRAGNCEELIELA